MPPGEQAPVGEVGEFGLIARIVGRLPAASGRVIGPGDDAAVVVASQGPVVATVDVLVEGIHFRRDWSSAYDVGRKAAAASLADVAAMGAVATVLLVGLGTPPDLPAAWADGLADGLGDEARIVGAGIEGGDVVAATVVYVSVTALGDLQGRTPVRRRGARPGDRVVLVGAPGRSAAGLALLETSHADVAPALVARHLRPEPPYAAGLLLAKTGATAMIDISDGLVADLGHVASASGVSIHLDSGVLEPDAAMAAAAAAVGVEPMAWVLGGGEDHLIAATVPPSWDITPALGALGARVVGAVEEGSGVFVDGRLAAAIVGEGGWRHFGSRGAPG